MVPGATACHGEVTRESRDQDGVSKGVQIQSEIIGQRMSLRQKSEGNIEAYGPENRILVKRYMRSTSGRSGTNQESAKTHQARQERQESQAFLERLQG